MNAKAEGPWTNCPILINQKQFEIILKTSRVYNRDNKEMEVVCCAKENFVSLILGTIGGILFAIGMCMCLLPEWGAFTQGVVIAVIGAVVLLILLLVRRKMEGKPAIHLSGKAVGSVLLGVVGALALGIGMCMVMVWNIMIPGILVGIIGIVLLLCLIPLVKGLK